VIFVHHKVYNLRRTDEDMSVSEALRIIFTAPSMTPEMILSRLTIVHEYEYKHTFQEYGKYDPDIGSVVIRSGEVIVSSANASVLEACINNVCDDEAYKYINAMPFASGSMEASTSSRKRSQLSGMESFADNLEEDGCMVAVQQ